MRKLIQALTFILLFPVCLIVKAAEVDLQHPGNYIFDGEMVSDVIPSPENDKLIINYRINTRSGFLDIIDLELSKRTQEVKSKRFEYNSPEWLSNQNIYAVENATGKGAIFEYQTQNMDFELSKIIEDPSSQKISSMKVAKKEKFVRAGGESKVAIYLPNRNNSRPRGGVQKGKDNEKDYDGIRIFDVRGHVWKPDDVLDLYPEDDNLYVNGSRGLVIEKNGIKKKIMRYRENPPKGESDVVESFIYDRDKKRLLINGHVLYDIENDKRYSFPSTQVEESTGEGLKRWIVFKYDMMPGRDLLIQYKREMRATSHYDDVCVSSAYYLIDLNNMPVAQMPAYFGSPKIIPWANIALISQDYIVIQTSGIDSKNQTIRGLMIYAILK